MYTDDGEDVDYDECIEGEDYEEEYDDDDDELHSVGDEVSSVGSPPSVSDKVKLKLSKSYRKK